MWSPVFETIFTSEFKEKNSCEIPLTGKRQVTQGASTDCLYTTLSGKVWKIVMNNNCYFFVKLLGQYQMEEIHKRREDVLVDLVSKKQGNRFLADLIFAQTYKLEKLLKTIVNIFFILFRHQSFN